MTAKAVVFHNYGNVLIKVGVFGDDGGVFMESLGAKTRASGAQ